MSSSETTPLLGELSQSPQQPPLARHKPSSNSMLVNRKTPSDSKTSSARQSVVLNGQPTRDYTSPFEHPRQDVCIPSTGPSFGINFDAIEDHFIQSRPSLQRSPLFVPIEDGSAKPSSESILSTPGSRFMFYSDSTGTIHGDAFETLPLTEYSMGIKDLLLSKPFWLDICNPTPDEMQLLGQLFGIHPLTVEDILTEETREKCETYSHYYFVCMRSFDPDFDSPYFLQPINFYIIVYRECVLSFHEHPVPHPNSVLRRMNQLKGYGLTISPEWINYGIIDDITDSFMPILRFIEREVDAIDDLVLILKESEQSDMLRRIGTARKQVMQLMKLLMSKADVLKALIKRYHEKVSADSETVLYLGDIQDHVITMHQNLNHYEKTLARCHSNYLAQISIEITQSSNRTSDVAMKMTALASILIPLNLITGLWGMNVKVPGQDEDSLVWFMGILAVMMVIASGTFYVIKRFRM
ncbi:uncharacterized protein BJ171DRAFT_493792, partial [Polychytrium aggregatum]|uniref:uncharacterized protein n=1 Tax=Polychytrium aggregatum TaxID=110093 RepID=UPI0022FDC890